MSQLNLNIIEFFVAGCQQPVRLATTECHQADSNWLSTATSEIQ